MRAPPASASAIHTYSRPHPSEVHHATTCNAYGNVYRRSARRIERLPAYLRYLPCGCHCRLRRPAPQDPNGATDQHATRNMFQVRLPASRPHDGYREDYAVTRERSRCLLARVPPAPSGPRALGRWPQGAEGDPRTPRPAFNRPRPMTGGLATAAREGMAGLNELTGSMAHASSFARVMRFPTQRISQAFKRLASVTAGLDEWDRRLQALGVPVPSDTWQPTHETTGLETGESDGPSSGQAPTAK